MSVSPTDEQETLRADLGAAALKLLESAATRERLLQARGDEPFPDDAWRALIAAGWAETIVPESLGGLGLGLAELGAIFKAVGRRLCRGPLLDQLVALPLLLRAAPEEARRHLREGIEGARLIVLAEAPEPPYGEGPEAVRLVGGRLTGTIDLVPFATRATDFVVLATGVDGPALLLLDATRATVESLPSRDPSVEVGRVHVRDGAVGVAGTLASGPAAAALVERIHAALRLMIAAELSGVTAELTDMAVSHAKVRQQFGRPIGGFQALRHVIARMAQRARSLENLTDASLADADAQPARMVELGMIAKAYAAQVGRSVAEDCLQVHGGIGFTAEYPLHLYMRRALTYQGRLGEEADLLTRLGRSALAE